MRLDHISVSVTHDNRPDEQYFKIRAQLKDIPEKQWQDGLKFVWYNSPYYLCNKSELLIEDHEVALLLDSSNDIQNAVDTLSSSIAKADKMVHNAGIPGVSYIANYRHVIN